MAHRPLSTPLRRKVEFARKLRKRMTPAEKRLWIMLRMKRFQGWKFRRQAPIGAYIVDFVSAKHCLIIELDGGIHAKQAAYDLDRTRRLRSDGFRMLRFANSEVLHQLPAVLRRIEELCLDHRKEEI